MRFFYLSVLAVSASIAMSAHALSRISSDVESPAGYLNVACSLAFKAKPKGEEEHRYFNEGFCEGIALGALQANLSQVMAYERGAKAPNQSYIKCINTHLSLMFENPRQALIAALDRQPPDTREVPSINAFQAINQQIKHSCENFK